ncbi:hypothetical protein D9613_012059 [Agrocybe pediades]|uniref:Major facilitator superfamily (MFS) profile domain-containing protein n=1 Tax=Agrocybe pediades TaxID=84607 RepID=A0A8H4VHU9_9AGAR|nr:hypothetical protein D9613_012059 [Agrocybe pediades]
MSSNKSDGGFDSDPEKGHDASSPSTAQVPGRVDVDSAHYGVKAVEAANKLYGKYAKWALFISLGLAAYIYSLDGTTTYFYLAYGTSNFDRHSFLSTIQVAQAIIVAVGKPVIAKVADIRSRGLSFVLVIIFYVVGYIVIASAENVETIAGGIILYAV